MFGEKTDQRRIPRYCTVLSVVLATTPIQHFTTALCSGRPRPLKPLRPVWDASSAELGPLASHSIGGLNQSVSQFPSLPWSPVSPREGLKGLRIRRRDGKSQCSLKTNRPVEQPSALPCVGWLFITWIMHGLLVLGTAPPVSISVHHSPVQVC